MMTYIDVNYIRQLQNEVSSYKDDVEEVLNGIVTAVKNKEYSYHHCFDFDEYSEYSVQQIVANLEGRGFTVNYSTFRNYDEHYYGVDVTW